MTRVSVSVMAHPNRAEQVGDILVHVPLGANRCGPVVAWDPEGPPSRDPDRIWRTARAGWQLYDPEAQWHVLVQDDAVPAWGWLAAFEAAVDHLPERAVASLYLGSVRPLDRLWGQLAARADAEGASWIVGNRPMWGVALACPTALIPEMIAYCDRQGAVPDDMRFGRWSSRNRLECWYPWPSLVDHREGPSLVGHHLERRARRFQFGNAVADWDPAGPAVRQGQRVR